MAPRRKPVEKKTHMGRGWTAVIGRAEAEEWIKKLLDLKADLEREWGALQALTGSSHESPLGSVVWRLFGAQREAVSKIVRDDISAIEWFIWDNDSGAKAFEHSLPDGTIKAVETVQDLLDVLGY